VNRPEAGKIYGGAVAAPVFKEIADKVYATQMDIHDQEERDYFARKLMPASARGDFQDLYTALTGMSYAVKRPTYKTELVSTDSSRAGVVLNPLVFGTDTIPDLAGLTAKDVVYFLEKAGLNPVIEGRGTVCAQSLPAGSPLVKGNEIILTLKDTIR
jgi:cell division protein FtsI (penicillin-binding protein 3)